MSTRIAVSASSPTCPHDVVGRSPWFIGALEAAQAIGILGIVALIAGTAHFFLFGTQGPAASGILAAAGAAWSVAFALPIAFLGGEFSLPPLTLSAIAFFVLWRSGRRAAEGLTVARIRGDVVPSSAAATFAALALLPALVCLGAMALASSLPLLDPAEGVRSAILILAAVAFGVLSYRGGDQSPREQAAAWFDHVTHGWGPVTAGLLSRALLGLLGLAVVVLAVALVVAAPDVAEVSRAYSSGVSGQIGLIVVQLAFLPVALVWALAWISGAGFGVGVGTLYAPTSVSAGPLPAIPALAAVPGEPMPVLVLSAFGVAAAGWWLGRRLSAHGGSEKARWIAASAAVVAVGLAAAAASVLSSGGLGPDRLLSNGPSLLFPVLIAAELALGSAAALLFHRFEADAWVRERVSGLLRRD